MGAENTSNEVLNSVPNRIAKTEIATMVPTVAETVDASKTGIGMDFGGRLTRAGLNFQEQLVKDGIPKDMAKLVADKVAGQFLLSEIGIDQQIKILEGIDANATLKIDEERHQATLVLDLLEEEFNAHIEVSGQQPVGIGDGTVKLVDVMKNVNLDLDFGSVDFTASVTPEGSTVEFATPNIVVSGHSSPDGIGGEVAYQTNTGGDLSISGNSSPGRISGEATYNTDAGSLRIAGVNDQQYGLEAEGSFSREFGANLFAKGGFAIRSFGETYYLSVFDRKFSLGSEVTRVAGDGPGTFTFAPSVSFDVDGRQVSLTPRFTPGQGGKLDASILDRAGHRVTLTTDIDSNGNISGFMTVGIGTQPSMPNLS